MVLMCNKAIFVVWNSSGSHKIAKHFLRAGKGWRAFKNRRQRVLFLCILQMIRFVYILMVKIIVAQISGRHLFEHWKAAHNFHWQEKVKLFNTHAANAWEQIKTLLVNFGLTVKELKKQLLLSALTELLASSANCWLFTMWITILNLPRKGNSTSDGTHMFFFPIVHRIVKTVLKC